MYSIEKIAVVIAGNFISQNVYPTDIQHLLYDSRLFSQSNQTLFFALASQRNDGQKYIKELYQKGIRHFVVQNEVDENAFPEANIILVKNTQIALQRLAKFHRQQFDTPTIGITGSNGKTIVKEWLYQLLQDDYQIVRSPKSYNSQIGVPISVWLMNETHDLAIFEAGISKANEMSQIAPIIRCDVGIFTNIGDAHSEGFSSIEEKVREKSLLFQDAEAIIYCKDHELIDKELSNFKNKELFTWSTGENATVSKVKIKKQQRQTKITAFYKQKVIDITIPFVDDASIENAISCWVALLFLRLQRIRKFQPRIQPKFLNLSGVELRLELKAAINNCTLINDSYSADLNSLTIALNFLAQQSTHQKRTIILSDILQSTLSKEDLYQQIGQLLLQKKISRLIAIGEEIKTLKNSIDIETTFYDTTDDFLKAYQSQDFQNETILIKGARTFQFEKIAYRLEQKVHQTMLEVRLNAFTHNLNIYRNRLKINTKLMVMVKADAYGHGSKEIAKLLEFNRVDYLAVAYVDEGVELRNNGIELPILVLNPEPVSFEAMVRFRLEPELYNFSLLHQFLDFLQHAEVSTPYPIHIKVDTGMHRLGFEYDEAMVLATELLKSPQLKVQSIFSHLSGSDVAQFDDFTKLQVERYQQFYKVLTNQLGYQPLRHILNSGGITRFPDYQMDMVRLGIGFYGIDASIQHELQTVSALKASISQIKTIQKDETIGYNRSGKANKNMRIATVSIGYADGLMRKASNGQVKLLVRGQQAPTIGNVCMDMTMLDITDILEAQEGDEVILFNERQDINELAKRLDTIAYELFTNISGRVKRVYVLD